VPAERRTDIERREHPALFGWHDHPPRTPDIATPHSKNAGSMASAEQSRSARVLAIVRGPVHRFGIVRHAGLAPDLP
jgi:hypothetical protein